MNSIADRPRHFLRPPQAGANGVSRTPCFYWKSCRRYAAVEKQGKSVCRECAERLKGIPYPLRAAAREPLYLAGWELARQLDMLERSHIRRLVSAAAD